MSAARRDGRTMIAVVLHAPSVYANSTGLLDRGFATPMAAERALPDHLPPLRRPAAHPRVSISASPTAVEPGQARTPTRFLAHGAAHLWDEPPGLALEGAGVGVALLRLRARRRERRRRALFADRWSREGRSRVA